jgi:glycosyltransferase involved in cell wall biosynthesis
MANLMASETRPVVSVIVPARNEEACLPLCLESLVTQTGIDFELIVVDDASTDRTAEIARTFITSRAGAALQARPELTVVPAPPLPDNWTGKNNAMAAGAKIAKGQWLLFTDADTVHKPGSLARAVAEAQQQEVALLSYSPEQEVRRFWEKAVMPVIFAELAATYPPKKVNDPASPIAAANGQYLLISREAYDSVGGHAKIASDLLEDVAMARLVKSSGRKIFFRYGGDAVRTRMYRSWAQMKEGWTKNLALLFQKPTELATARLWQFIFLLTLPPSIARGTYWGNVTQSSTPLIRWQYVILGLVVHIIFFWWSIAFVIRMRRAHCGWRGIIPGFFGLPVFAYLLWRSHRAYKRARFDWKGRTYVYSEYEVEHLAHRFSLEPEYGKWQKVWAWLRNGGRA